MSTQVDRQSKANIDRLDRRKMNSLKRVVSLPARGSSGDWLVVEETRTQNGEKVKVDVTYAWMDNRWTLISDSARGDVEVVYSSEFGETSG